MPHTEHVLLCERYALFRENALVSINADAALQSDRRCKQRKTHVALEIVKRPLGAKGFVVIRRRWVVERTFAWIMKCRRLVRDYEQLTAVAETLITIAAIATFVRRAA